MKKFNLLFIALLCSICFGQDKLLTKTGTISFESADTTFQDVKAKNEGVTFVLNIKTGEVASLAIMKEFHFKIALMEEHFNESYAESDKFPKSVFRGTLENFDVKNLTPFSKDFNLKGNLELHGYTIPVSTIAKIKKTSAGIEILADFTVVSTDFGIQIPTMAKNNVTNKVIIKTEFTVAPPATTVKVPAKK